MSGSERLRGRADNETREVARHESQETARQRCGFVALIGAPNAGKSTLVNNLVGAKVSIVTHKVQTTRSRIRGIVCRGASQIVLIDTPGIFAPRKRRRLERAMVEAAWKGALDADIVSVLVDAARGIDERVEQILARLSSVASRPILLLNKIDLVAKPKLLELAAALNERVPFERTFMVSALSGDGLEDFANYLVDAVPPGPWHYPEDQLSDAPLWFLAAEITREKLTLRLHQELPYALSVETTSWRPLRDGSVRIEQTVFVERESQKQIVLGKGGRTIKAVSMEARRELGEILEAEVHLFLFVKVRPNWSDDPERYEALGLERPD